MTTFDPAEARIASPGQRFLGFLIDVLILTVLAMPVTIAFMGDELLDTSRPPGSAAIPPGLTLTVTIMTGVYFIVFTALRGQTPGKMFLRTRVLAIETGRLPGWGQSFIRWAIPAAAGSIPPLGLLVIPVYAWLLFDRYRQGFHDKVAQTVVVDVRPRLETFDA